MAYTSLYRKYRPQTFDSMIGQNHIRQTLKNAIISGNIAHAYLFTGTRGTGKTSTAKIFAKAINCEHPNEDGSPCNECETCKALSSPNNLDIIELDAASNNSVEDIRNLIEKVKYAPSIGKYKVYIVDEVHMLSAAAFNAFLKTLEEPPEYVVFILATTEVQKLPATILSRCIRFDFRLIPKDELANHIIKIFNDMKIAYEKEAAFAIAEAGNGSVRDALSVADMVISYCGNKIVDYNSVLDVLGASSPENIVELCEEILNGEVENALTLSNKLLNMGKSVTVLADDLAKMMNNIMFARNCSDAKNMLGLPTELYSRIKDATVAVSNYKICRAIEIFAEVQSTLRYSSLSKVVLETAIAKACDITVSIDVISVLDRLKELEAFRRTVQGATTKEGTTLTGNNVWGSLLNELKLNSNMLVEYNIANAVQKGEALVVDRVLILNIKNKALYEELDKYINVYKKYIQQHFYEILDVKLNLIIDQKEKDIIQVQDLFENKLKKE